MRLYSAAQESHKAIVTGKIKRPKRCSVCKEERSLVAHHDDYTKALKVRWLCHSCHRKWHAINVAKSGKGDKLVSWSIPVELLRKLAEIANREHRSIAAQGVLFLEGSVESYWRMVVK